MPHTFRGTTCQGDEWGRGVGYWCAISDDRSRCVFCLCNFIFPSDFDFGPTQWVTSTRVLDDFVIVLYPNPYHLSSTCGKPDVFADYFCDVEQVGLYPGA